jgi:hypothetical protein
MIRCSDYSLSSYGGFGDIIEQETHKYNLICNLLYNKYNHVLPLRYGITNVASLCRSANRLLMLDGQNIDLHIINFQSFCSYCENLKNVFLDYNFFGYSNTTYSYLVNVFSNCKNLENVDMYLPSYMILKDDDFIDYDKKLIFSNCDKLPENILNNAPKNGNGSLHIDSNYARMNLKVNELSIQNSILNESI